MIYDPKSGALYADDGSFLKTVHCPLALRVEDLASASGSTPDRQCHACKEVVRCADDMTDLDMAVALDESPDLCVFATPEAKHIVVLRPAGVPVTNVEGLPVIRTARSIRAMEEAYRDGHRLLIKVTGPFSEIGAKYKLFQHRLTGEIWCTGDFRSSSPDHGDSAAWELVADWFNHRPDWPFPVAAYLIPRGLRKGQRVYLEDLVEDIPIAYWNQGDSHRLVSSPATWSGDEFELEKFEAPPAMMG